MLFFKRNWSPLFFISVSCSFSVVLANVDIKLSRMKDSASLLLFFISKSPGGYTIYCRNARVLEMQNFTPAYMKGWTHVRNGRTPYGRFLVRTKISRKIFLPMVLRCPRFARAPLKLCWMVVRWVLL